MFSLAMLFTLLWTVPISHLSISAVAQQNSKCIRKDSSCEHRGLVSPELLSIKSYYAHHCHLQSQVSASIFQSPTSFCPLLFSISLALSVQSTPYRHILPLLFPFCNPHPSKPLTEMLFHPHFCCPLRHIVGFNECLLNEKNECNLSPAPLKIS